MKKYLSLFCVLGLAILTTRLFYPNKRPDEQARGALTIDVSLPWNEFRIPPGYAFYVGLPDYAGRTENKHRTLPTMVDVDLFAHVVQKEFPNPLHLRVVMKAEDDEGRKTAAVTVEQVGYQNVGNFSTGTKIYPLKEGEELTIHAGKDEEWNLDGAEGLKWKILTLGAIGGRVVDVLVMLAPRPELISSRLKIPEKYVFRDKVLFDVLEVGPNP